MHLSRRLLAFTRDCRLPLAFTILAGLLAGWLTIWQARSLSLVINRVYLDHGDLGSVSAWMALLLILIGLRALLAWFSEASAAAVAETIKGNLRTRIFRKLLLLGPAGLRAERTGELATAALEGVDNLEGYFSQYLPQLVLAAVVPLSILIFVFPLDPLSGLLLLVTAPLIPLFMVLIGRSAEVETKRQYQTLAGLSAHFLDSLQGLETLKQYGRSLQQTGSIREASERFRDVTLGVLRITFLSALALELIATVSTALVAVEVSLRLLYGHLPFDLALFLLILAPEFYIPLRMLGTRFHAGMAGTTAARRIFEILDLPGESAEEIYARVQPEAHPLPPLELANVSFSYPGEARHALREVSLVIQPGEHVAVVGASGAGKSTLAALLLRFLSPASGRITAGGVDLADIPLAEWRALVAWVPQNPYLFRGSIASNLRLASPEAGEGELLESLRAACLDDFVRTLPAGLATEIGEQGVRLSGGQAQRLALARALLKDAPLIVLDEPTSSLDPQSEALFEEAASQLMKGRTVITIAHRLNTVTQADRIFVLEQGRLVEAGTHQDLMARHGLYASMVQAATPDRLEEGKDTGAAVEPGWEQQPIPAGPSSGETVLEAPMQKPPALPRVFLHLIGFLSGSFGWVLLSVLLGSLTIASSVGLLGTSAWLIAMAAMHPDLSVLSIAIVGVRFFGIARGVFRYLERLSTHSVTFRLLAKLRVWFYSRLEPLAPARLMEFHSGDLLNRILADVQTLENFYVRAVAPSCVALVISGGMALLLGHFNPQLGWAYLGFALLLGAAVPLLVYGLSRTPGSVLLRQRALLRSRLVDMLQGLPDLLAFQAERETFDQLRAVSGTYDALQRRQARTAGFGAGASVLLANLGMWSILVLVVPSVSAGRLPGVMLPVLTLMTLSSFEAVAAMPLAVQNLSESLQAGRRLFEVVDTDPEVRERSGGRVLPRLERLNLRVQHLVFSYPSTSHPALQEISFSLNAGGRLALVGPSGAGKSTLLALLMRYWEYRRGSIQLGSIELHDLSAPDVRSQLGLLSQRSYFFNDTVRANLLLARPEANEEQLYAAAAAAQIHDFILSLPAGYDTQIGERGLRLSGGERQRLAIARVLLQDAPILLLDEPTAHLDPASEAAVLDTVLAVSSGKSLLLATHRLLRMEAMDEILVVVDGHLVERGTHTSLLRLQGIYRRMFDLQQRTLPA
jgi:ATP-binding cassette subfamily C protein CydCD